MVPVVPNVFGTAVKFLTIGTSGTAGTTGTKEF
jgi:hypothetical protein